MCIRDRYKKIRPGEPLSVESAESLINAMFFDPRRYDLAKVGRYKFNKKLMLRNRIRGHELAEDVVDTTTGEILAAAGTKVTAELADTIQNSAVPYVYIQTEEKKVKVLSNMMVDLTHYVDCNPRELGISELVYYPALVPILEQYSADPEALADAIRTVSYTHLTRAKSRVLPDGNRARRTLFYFGMRWETCGRYFDARGDFCLQSIWAHKTRGSLDVACKPG